MERPKLLIVALDAADGRLLQDWASEGFLPTFSRLFRTGVSGAVETPPGLLDGAIWPSLLTGLSPGNHGLFASRQLQPGTYKLKSALCADNLPAQPFWFGLSEKGMRVAVVDAPFAKPLDRLNGIQITNWGAHDDWSYKRSSWPPRLLKDVVSRFGDHPVTNCDLEDRMLGNYEALRDQLISGVKKKTALLQYCLGLEDWDFFFGAYSEAHCAGHQLWHLTDRNHPEHDPGAPAELQTAIRDVYQAIDEGLASILDNVPSRAHVMILLSHGMGPYYHGSHLLEEILEKAGINNPRTAYSPELSATVSQHILKNRHALPKNFREAVKGCLPPNVVNQLWKWLHPQSKLWTKMRVFPVRVGNMTGALRINLKGREPSGLVEPGREFEELRDRLIDEFMGLENADTGRKAVQWVKRSEDLYQGRCTNALPDLFIEWDHTDPIGAIRSPRFGIVRDVLPRGRSGSHLPGGFLFAAGSQIKAGESLNGIRSVDISATVLDFFGLPIPTDLDGRSILSLLRREESNVAVTASCSGAL